MFCPPREAKKGISLWTNTSVQRCLYPLFQNQSPHFLFSLFWKSSQLLGKDQQSSKQTYCRLSIIFLWPPKGFIFPEYFLNFLLNLYIPPWLRKSFKFIVLRLHLWVKKLNLFNFTHASKQNSPPGYFSIFTIIPQADGNCPILPNSIFWRYFFTSRKRGGGLHSWKNYQN